MLKSFACMIAGHHVDRHRVWHDSINFRTACTRCGNSLLRDQAGWRKFDSEHDADALRTAHPGHESPVHDRP